MKLVLAVVALFIPFQALAQTRPDARRLSCGQARAVVLSQGAIVLGTGAYTYDRYVSGSQFCLRPQIAEPAWIATVDTGQCFVGYICRERPAPPGR